MSVRVLELFSGIGGAAEALSGVADVVLAVDQDAAARATYAQRWPHPTSSRNLHHVKVAWFEAVEADLWWMSPPCQPYTIRGNQRDLEDRRSQALLRIIDAIDAVRPRHVALENVPWFAGSEGESRLRAVLDHHGYDVSTELLCPTALGVPAARRRYYLVASRDGLGPPGRLPIRPRTLDAYLDADPDPALIVEEELARRYEGALHIVDADDPLSTAACFTGAYGRSPVYAGSYVRQDGVVRRFAPEEIAATLGFPQRVRFPEEVGSEKRWRLVGNSLSVFAVRSVLARIPALEPGLRAAQDAA